MEKESSPKEENNFTDIFRKGIEIYLKTFTPDTSSPNTLIRRYDVVAKGLFSNYHTSIVDRIKWDEEKILIQREIAPYVPFSSSYSLRWEYLQKHFKEKKDVSEGELETRLYVPNTELDKLLKLREIKCEIPEDVKYITELLALK